KSLSRRHARIDFDGRTFKVTDVQSKNGIYFQGKRVESCEVPEGESFRCGDITFLLELPTTRAPKTYAGLERAAQTLPSPYDAGGRRRGEAALQGPPLPPHPRERSLRGPAPDRSRARGDRRPRGAGPRGRPPLAARGRRRARRTEPSRDPLVRRQRRVSVQPA